MSAQLIAFPRRYNESGQAFDPELTKRDLAALWRCSVRSIDRYMDANYMAERGRPPLPSFTTPTGGVRFLLSQATEWRRGK